jgi:anti-sigma factor RsiW
MTTMDEMACQELVERVTEYLDTALADTDRARFEDHIGECPGCVEVLEQFRAVVRLTGALAPDLVAEVDPMTRDTLVSAFRTWHNQRG